jgi:7-cyano-7-deazaguanine synthase
MLLSGGLDSVTALAWALREGLAARGALSFTYGQRHAREVGAAAAVASRYGVPHQTVALVPIGGLRLTDLGDIPQGHDLGALRETVAPTYVPNRNRILISYAAAHTLLGGATHLIGGWHAADRANYPDCRETFLAASERTLRLATKRGFTIVRPLIGDDKPAIIRCAIGLGAPAHLTGRATSAARRRAARATPRRRGGTSARSSPSAPSIRYPAARRSTGQAARRSGPPSDAYPHL